MRHLLVCLHKSSIKTELMR